jgi:large subunit ribosomal protein L25
VKALPKDLPDFIIANISKLELGNKLYTSELQTETFDILHPDNTVVCQVRTSRASIKLDEEVDTDQTQEEGAEATEAAAEN